MRDVKIIAFDLDGTFLADDKSIPETNIRTLNRMKDKKIYAVPCTGRLFAAIPEPIREHPAVRYAITENGAGIYDKFLGKPVYTSGIRFEDVMPLIEYGKSIPCLYDCYQDAWGWMPQSAYEKVPEFLSFAPIRKMVLDYRTPLADFETVIRERGTLLQKFQYFFRDTETRDYYLPVVTSLFPGFEISKSSPLNIEINERGTNKGNALKKLAEMTNVPISETAAFGDDINDLAILQVAGISIAMENAIESVKEAADHVTIANNDGGVAYGCHKYLDL